MRKFLVLLLCGISLMTGCSNSESSAPVKSTDSAEESTVTDEVVPTETEEAVFTVTKQDIATKLQTIHKDIFKESYTSSYSLSNVQDLSNVGIGISTFVSNYDNSKLSGIQDFDSDIYQSLGQLKNDAVKYTLDIEITETNMDEDGFSYFANSQATVYAEYDIHIKIWDEHDSSFNIDKTFEPYKAVFVLEDVNWKINQFLHLGTVSDYDTVTQHLYDENRKTPAETIENFGMLDEWKQCYINYFDEYDHIEFYSYEIADTDGTGIPKIYIRKDISSKLQCIGILDNNVKIAMGADNVYYIPDKKLVMYEDIDRDSNEISLDLYGTEPERIIYAWESDTSSGDETTYSVECRQPEYHYYKNITQKEYWNKIKEYFDFEKALYITARNPRSNLIEDIINYDSKSVPVYQTENPLQLRASGINEYDVMVNEEDWLGTWVSVDNPDSTFEIYTFDVNEEENIYSFGMVQEMEVDEGNIRGIEFTQTFISKTKIDGEGGEMEITSDGLIYNGSLYKRQSSNNAMQQNNIGDYILPASSSQYLSEQDLSGLSKEQLRLARNEIYARHGLTFTKDDTKQYFKSKSWYKATVSEVTDNMLNEYEIANRDLIISMEGN